MSKPRPSQRFCAALFMFSLNLVETCPYFDNNQKFDIFNASGP